jgi:hypothetical protein
VVERTVASGILFLCSSILVLSACGTESTGSSPAPRVADSSRALALDTFCLETINAFRATEDLAPLKMWSDSASCLARQAATDAASRDAHGSFPMCGERAQNTCPGWPADTSLAKQRSVLRSCVQMMWNEGPGSDFNKHGHYLNMVNPSYTKVGCGFHLDNGSLWINMDFR